MRTMRKRDFASAEVFCHPPIGEAAFKEGGGHIRADIPYEVATVCKNESNCTVFLKDGTWFTTWGQGSHEGHPDERIVFAVSRDMGKTWSPPSTIQASCPEREERVAYGIPFVVPETDRIYLFFFLTANTEGKLWASEGRLDHALRRFPEHGSGRLHFVYSDDAGESWSPRRRIVLPRRDINAMPDRFHGWVNHPPQIMPTGEVSFTFSAHGMSVLNRRAWQLGAAEVNVVRCENILSETDPEKLRFTLLPKGPRGIRADAYNHWNNPSLRRLLDFFDGVPEDTAWNFQEMTIVPMDNGRWLGVGRTFLGSPGFTVSSDRGESWTPAEPLCYAPDGQPIAHPMTMCPIAKTSDGRYVLLFCNNDGSQRGARHVWDGDGRTRNPQWILVGCEIPGETRNGGLVFGEPMILAEVDDSGEVNLKTGISMPQFFEREGRTFVCYNVNKEHIVLDEIPVEVLDRLTPALP